MRKIPLTQGKFALVDDADFERVSKFKWHAYRDTRSGIWYARKSKWNGSRVIQISMHRYLFGLVLYIDHRNHNGLDNRRKNLRAAKMSQNMHNRRKQSNNKSGIIGIYWKKSGRKWCASICVCGRRIYLGLFVHKKDAAAAYRKAAKKYFGEFARVS